MRRLVIFVCSLLLLAATASAQTATVVTAAPIYITPNSAEGQVPLRVAEVGTTLRVMGSERGWQKVEFQDPQGGPAQDG